MVVVSGRERLALWLYALLLRLATPAYLLRIWWRGRSEPVYRSAWWTRLGWGLPRPVDRPLIWCHAVSLGEAKAARPLVEALRRQCPGHAVLLTHTTATGRHTGAELLAAGDLQTWLPYDTPGAVRRFLRAYRPAVGILMETEVWPVLLDQARRAGVPMVLANARLSERSARRGRRFVTLLGPAARALNLVLAQSDEDAARLREAGAGQVEVSGNLKFDLAPSGPLMAQGRGWRVACGRPVVVLANSRPGEERTLLGIWPEMVAARSDRPLLLIVPRHPQRFDEVADLIRLHGLQLWRRSSSLAPEAAAWSADVWLGDSLGELSLYYGMADVALLGGSFEPLGGHNLIESLACGCPMVLGPSVFNFAAAAEAALAAGAVVQRGDMASAVSAALDLLDHPQAREDRALRAEAFALAHRGAAARMAGRISALLSAQGDLQV
ncbi:3-deoxy-D-manno-octulosonic acid transferase [Ideonella livida]|uniref:3-deoxy-D-manno-octulosonic acid transferase n=1 Tax=Ideonella livida TaxID=2707176 RepID=A0A7C9TM85_9BURK|nr:3-deoxy-D-manno-octulosonic acid transferase [Ideonella livida]NDY92147.1 3-deoxy-D-manno-octulosonic acid transferase [Ideonella livida]